MVQIILFTLALASPAYADCPAPPIGNANDMVVSFMAIHGTQNAPASLMPSTVKEGMLIYDSTADSLKLCDGTNWQSISMGTANDPRIGTLDAGKWCSTDGTIINCTTDAPATVVGNDKQVIFNDGGATLAGAAQLFWDKASNRLGLGTSTPPIALVVNPTNAPMPGYSAGTDRIAAVSAGNSVIQVTAGAAAQSAVFFSDVDSRSAGGLVYSHATDTMQVRVADSIKMTVLPSGHVGINTGIPAKLLHVHSVNAVDEPLRVSASGGSGSIQGKAYIGFHHWGPAASDTVHPSARIGVEETDNADYDASLVFQTRSADADIEPETRLVITEEGRVGINTLAPGHRLTVNGNTYISGNVGINAVPQEAYALRLYQQSLNGTGAHVIYAQHLKNPTSSGTYYGIAGNLHSTATIPAGVTDGGYLMATNASALRTNAGDAGALEQIYGIRVQYGHYTGTGGATARTTNSAYGIVITPYHENGTITNSYALYINPGSGGGTVGTQYGIYQAGTAANYLGGSLGIGTNAPTAKLDIVGDIRIRGGAPGAGKVLTSDATGAATWQAAASDSTADGATTFAAGITAANIYTPYVSLPKGVYYASLYNCLAAASADYYVNFTAESNSGAGSISSSFSNRNFNQMTSYDDMRIIVKVRAATANVRFRLYHAGGGTITTGSPTCTAAYYTQIAS